MLLSLKYPFSFYEAHSPKFQPAYWLILLAVLLLAFLAKQGGGEPKNFLSETPVLLNFITVSLPFMDYDSPGLGRDTRLAS